MTHTPTDAHTRTLTLGVRGRSGVGATGDGVGGFPLTATHSLQVYSCHGTASFPLLYTLMMSNTSMTCYYMDVRRLIYAAASHELSIPIHSHCCEHGVFPSLYFLMGCSELLSRSPTARLTVDPLVFLFCFVFLLMR